MLSTWVSKLVFLEFSDLFFAYFEAFLLDIDLLFGMIWNSDEFPTQKIPILLVYTAGTWQKSKIQIFSLKIGIFVFFEQRLPSLWYFCWFKAPTMGRFGILRKFPMC